MSSKTRTKFDLNDVAKRFNAQGGRCAGCGKTLVWANCDKGDRGAWHAHHIDGDPSNSTFGNCACVCINDPQNCHLACHSGDFANGAVVGKSKLKVTGW